MAKAKWISSKKHPGVKWRESTAKGRLYYIVYNRNGRNHWEKVGYESEGYSLALAATIRANRIKAIRHGDELPCDQMPVPTFGEVAAKYVEWAVGAKKSGKDDASRYKHYLSHRFGNKYVNEISGLDIERMKRELTAQGLSPATVKQAMALFRAIFNKGIDWNLIKVPSPMKGVKLPNLDNARERLLTPEDVAVLLAALKKRSDRAHDFAFVAYHTGGRFSEIKNLSWADIDTANGVVTYRGTKNGGTRRIPMNRLLLSFFRERAKSVEDRTGPVFLSRKGECTEFLTKAFQRTADELFNKELLNSKNHTKSEVMRLKVVFHSLRHAFASQLVGSNVPLTVVKELTGHKSLVMLERYSHCQPGAQKAAVEFLTNIGQPVERKLEVVA